MLFKFINDNNIFNNLYKMNKDTNDCIICFEYKKQNETTVKMNSQEVYINFCPCNIYIHISCLEIWFNQKGTCPICHEQIYENNWYKFTSRFIKKYKNMFVFFYLLTNFINIINIMYNIINSTHYYEEPPQTL